jgi:hypothetical protein
MLNLLSIIKGLLIQNDTDRTKEVAIEADVASTTGTRTTLKAKQTVDRSIDLPDADDTLIGKATTDTLTNKTIDGDTNTIQDLALTSLKTELAKANKVLSRDGLGVTVDAKDAPGGEFVGDTDTQTITNKSIDSDNNTITNIVDADIKAAAAIDATKIGNGDVDNTELSRLNGLTGDVQTQLDAKIDDYGAGVDNSVMKSNAAGDAVERSGVLIDDTNNVTIPGDLTVNGTTTTLNTATLDVTDTNITVNKTGTDGSSEGAGLTVERTGTDGSIIYEDALASKFKLGALGSEVEVVDVSSTQTVTNKNLASSTNTITGASADSITRATGNQSVITIPDATVADDVVLEDHAQTVTNKTITTSNIDLTGAASATNRAVVSSDTSTNLGLLARKKGAVYFDDTTNTYKGDDGTSLIDLGGGGGQGGINYISNPDIENDTSGWSLYNDGASATPVDGTGGTASGISLGRTVNASIIVRGVGSLQLIKDGASKQGQGFSTDFTIDNADDNGKKLNVSFEYSTVNPGFVSGDIAVFVYDIDNTTLIGRVSNDNDGDVIATADSSTHTKFQGEFYTTSSKNYRLIFHIATTNTSAHGMILDNVKVGPEQFAPGAIITEWEAYTPTTQGFGSISSVDCWWRRVGSNYELSIDFNSGTNTGVEAQIGLPNGKAIDSSIASSVKMLGSMGTSYATSIDLNVLGTSGDSFLNMGRGDTASSGLTPVNGNSIGNGSDISFTVSVPIEGLKASNLVSTTEALFSTAKARYKTDSGQVISTGSTTIIDFDGQEYDDQGLVTTGASWKFTAPKTGYYSVKSALLFAGSTAWTESESATFILFKNGAVYSNLDRETQFGATSTFMQISGSDTIKLVKGDYIDIRINQNSGANQVLYTGDDKFTYVTIEELPDFSVFGVYGETELVEASSGFISFPITASTYGDLATISLSPGEWDIQAHAVYYSNGATTTSLVQLGINNVSGTTSPGTEGIEYLVTTKRGSSTNRDTLTLSRNGIIVTSTENWYLKAAANTSTTNLEVAYKISARRVK